METFGRAIGIHLSEDLTKIGSRRVVFRLTAQYPTSVLLRKAL